MAKLKMDWKWIWIGLIIIAVLNFGVLFKPNAQTVAQLQSASCSVDKDCPCWGTYNFTQPNITAYGIGSSSCNNNTHLCDTTYCADVQPVGEWLRDSPFVWIKNNILITFGILALAVFIAIYPKN